MFDTIAHKITLPSSVARQDLINDGFEPRFNPYGDVRKWIKNAPIGSKLPRMTVSKCPRNIFHFRLECSISAFLSGNNLILPTLNDLPVFYRRLNDYVAESTNFAFRAQEAELVRLDMTRDYRTEAENVIPTLKQLIDSRIPYMETDFLNGTTIRFQNKGKIKSRRFNLYSKLHDAIDKKLPPHLQEIAKGILRMEAQFKTKNEINRLVGILGLKRNASKFLLRPEISTKILDELSGRLAIKAKLNTKPSNLEQLLKQYSLGVAGPLLGFACLVHAYGFDFYKIPSLNYKKSTYFNNMKRCKAAGLFS